MGGGKNEPSARLRPVLGEILRDQSKLQEIASRLQREDPDLLREVIALMASSSDSLHHAKPTQRNRARRCQKVPDITAHADQDCAIQTQTAYAHSTTDHSRTPRWQWWLVVLFGALTLFRAS